MKEIIKHTIIIICLVFGISSRAQSTINIDEAIEEFSHELEDVEVVEEEIEKKEFDSETYQKLKEDVDLIEEMEQKRLQADSSQFGVGYGVEQGDDYVIYHFDTVSGTGTYIENHRGSGERNIGDGVQPDAREYKKRKAFHRRAARERGENRRRDIDKEKLKRQKEKERPEEEEKEKTKNSSNNSGDGFFKFLLIIIIAGVLGAAVYFLFLNAPVEGNSAKIFYDQEMNPEAVQLSELEIKINAAKDEKDYRSATRLYFVWVIKELSDKGYIQWKKRKTNYNYLLETEGKPFHKDFESAVKNYEFIWYGKYELKEADFNVIENHFKNLINKI